MLVSSRLKLARADESNPGIWRDTHQGKADSISSPSRVPSLENSVMTSPRNVKLKEIELADDFIVYVNLLALTFLCRIITYSQADSVRLEENDNRYFNGNGPDIPAEAMSESLEGYIQPSCMWTILIDILLIILQLKKIAWGLAW